ncbi:hypothetical protein CEXT_131451 [Caerostris extrusa]|uniref:Uncharacterized protein n=1 Tax=Caerostris extrusa TaxID=172846 RepID=A0AAV4N8K7_CAEEX|nr:hypothetical protein CEXT_131451 [Caerostris extrusa]
MYISIEYSDDREVHLFYLENHERFPLASLSRCYIVHLRVEFFFNNWNSVVGFCYFFLARFNFGLNGSDARLQSFDGAFKNTMAPVKASNNFSHLVVLGVLGLSDSLFGFQLVFRP